MCCLYDALPTSPPSSSTNSGLQPVALHPGGGGATGMPVNMFSPGFAGPLLGTGQQLLPPQPIPSTQIASSFASPGAALQQMHIVLPSPGTAAGAQPCLATTTTTTTTTAVHLPPAMPGTDGLLQLLMAAKQPAAPLPVTTPASHRSKRARTEDCSASGSSEA